MILEVCDPATIFQLVRENVVSRHLHRCQTQQSGRKRISIAVVIPFLKQHQDLVRDMPAMAEHADDHCCPFSRGDVAYPLLVVEAAMGPPCKIIGHSWITAPSS